jgi:hypothetical protein
MKSILLLLQYFQSASLPIRLITWLGWGLLAASLVIGLLWRGRVTFGIAVWTFFVLLVFPAFAAPLALRTLLSNRRLMIMPGFARNAVLALFVYAVLTAAFLPCFAWLYAIPHFPANVMMYVFALLSIYFLITFFLAGVQWGMQMLGILIAPIIIFGSKTLNGAGQLPQLDTGELYALTVVVLLCWALALLFVPKVRHVAPPKIYGLQQDQQMLTRMATSLGPALWASADNKGSPALSLMLGYPANNYSVVRLKLLAGLLGPLPMVAIVQLTDIGRNRFSWPEILMMLMFVYSFSAVLMGIQNAELVARLRLLWLKAPRLRKDLWTMLDTQHLLSQLTFLLLTSLLAAVASFALSFAPLLLLHYPLLLLALNANTSYYSIYARINRWSMLTGFIVIGTCLAVSGWLVAKALHSDTVMPLLALEVVLLGLALTWRQLAKAQFSHIDWQALKPMNTRRGVAS